MQARCAPPLPRGSAAMPGNCASPLLRGYAAMRGNRVSPVSRGRRRGSTFNHKEPAFQTVTARIVLNPQTARKVFTNEDLMHLVLAFCPSADMMRMRLINRAMYAIFKSYVQRTISIERILKRFFPEPDAFRVVQRQTGTLISGSQALQFFDRSYYPESDLDLYLFPGREYDVGRFLLGLGYDFAPVGAQLSTFPETDARGYARDPRPDAYPTWLWEAPSEVFERDYPQAHGDYTGIPDLPEDEREARQIVHVYNFRKQDPDDPMAHLKIQLVVTKRSPIETMLTSFHSTIVLNMISYEKAYSLYAHTTFMRRQGLELCDSMVDKVEQALDKYRRRGWTIIHNTPKGTMYGRAARFVDDSESWVIPLLPIDDRKYDDVVQGLSWAGRTRSFRHDPVCATSWLFSEYSDSFGTPCGLKFYIVGGSSLKYSYIIEDRTHLKTWDLSRNSKSGLTWFNQQVANARRKDLPQDEELMGDMRTANLKTSSMKDSLPSLPPVMSMMTTMKLNDSPKPKLDIPTWDDSNIDDLIAPSEYVTWGVL